MQKIEYNGVAMKKKFALCIVLLLLSAVAFAACKAEVEFTDTTYRVGFLVDGMPYRTITTTGNESVRLPGEPKKDGYAFDGWYFDQGTWRVPFTADSFLNAPISDNVSVYAKWRSAVAAYALGTIIVRSRLTEDFLLDPGRMTAAEKSVYDPVVNMYGRLVTVREAEIVFDGVSMSTYNPASFTKVGRNIIFSNGFLDDNFSFVTLENEVLSFGFVTLGTGFVLEYYSPDYVTPVYKITFDYSGATGGNALKTLDMPFSAALGNLPAPTRPGYTFAGWKLGDTIVGSATKFTARDDVVLVAQWTGDPFKMLYSYDGATGGNALEDKTVEYGAAVGILPLPTRLNYDFGGWFTGAAGSGTQVTADYVWKFESDTTVYAKWIGKATTLTFNYQGGDGNIAVLSKPATFGAAVGELPIPTKTGSTFGGWFTEAGGAGTRYEADTLYNASDNTLYAKWDMTIVFAYESATGGNTVTNKAVTYNAAVGALPAPTRSGFTFGGWYTSRYGEGTLVTEATRYLFETGVTVYARWNASLAFDYRGATGGDATTLLTVTLGKAVGVLPAPTKSGYAFGGWYTAADGAGTQYTATTTFLNTAGAMTLYAKWNPQYGYTYTSDILTVAQPGYVISFDLNGGSGTVPAPQLITGTVGLTYPAIPVRSGYLFAGWYDNSAATGTPFNFAATVTQSRTLYAKWIQPSPPKSWLPMSVGETNAVSIRASDRQYYAFVPLVSQTLSFTIRLNGVTTSPYPWIYVNTVATTTSPSGYGSLNVTVTAGTLYYVGVESYSNYTGVQYVGDGTVVINGTVTPTAGGLASGAGDNDTVTFGEQFTLPVPVKSGYTFGGWWSGLSGTGTQYTNALGVSLRPWDLGVGAYLYAKWT